MSPIWFHLEPEYALYQRRMAIAVPDELQERGMQGLHGCAWQVGDLPANHRSSGCALEARRKASAVQGELRESAEAKT